MAVTAAEIMLRASVILNDAGATRWPAYEMLDWINDGQRAIVMAKPSANSQTVPTTLAAGTEQDIPATAHQILRILRNTGGAAVTMVDRDIMDQHVPGWSDDTVWPQQTAVEHCVYDVAQPETFDVFPPNDGAGSLDIVCSILPTDLAEPANNRDEIASYTATISIDDSFREALVDYVLYRSFSKDAQHPNAASRAMAYFQTFQAAIGVKTAREARDNPDMTQGV